MKQRTPTEASALDANIRAGILANKTVGEIATDLNLTQSYLYTLMRRRLKVEKVLLFEHERGVIKDMRARALSGRKV